MTVAIAMTITACSPQEEVCAPQATVTESVLKVQEPPTFRGNAEKKDSPTVVKTEAKKETTTETKPTSESKPAAKNEYKPKSKPSSEPTQAKTTSKVEQNIKSHLQKYKVSQSDSEKYAALIVKHSESYGVDPYTILAMMQVETGETFNPNLVGRNNDVGLLQIRPTAQRATGTKGDRRDPSVNIEIGAKYLAYNQKRFGDELGIVAYNQGEGNVKRGTYNTKYLTRVNKALATISR